MATVPTDLQRAGDFSQTFNDDGSLQTIYNPFSTTTDAEGNVLRDPFPDNKIPASLIAPISKTMQSISPEPTGLGNPWVENNFQTYYPDQTDMGTMTWQLTQNGSMVTGSMSFSGSGMHGRMPGSFVGTMSGDDMTFTMDMPAGSMMMGGTCSAHSTGTAHMDAGAMTMTGNYSGTNSCAGSFNNGQMTMTRR